MDRFVERRTFIKSAAGAIGSAVLVGHAVARAGSPAPVAPGSLASVPNPSRVGGSSSEEMVRAMGLHPGQVLGRWEIMRVDPMREGAVAVGMRTRSGEAFQVDVVRRSPGHEGLADTRHFSVFLVNNGTGSTRSDEEQGCGAIMLGRYLGLMESQGLRPPTELLTFDQRRRIFSGREAGRRVA